MMQTIATSLVERSSDLSDAIANYLDVAGGAKFDTGSWTSGHGLTTEALITRAGTLADTAKSLAALPIDRLVLAPSDRLIHFSDQIRQLVESMNALSQAVSNVRDWGGLSSYSDGKVIADNGSQVNVRNYLNEVMGHEDAALQAYADIGFWTRSKGVGTFTAASKALASNAKKSGDALQSIEERLKDINERIESVGSREQVVAAAQEEAQRLTSEIEKARKTSDENEQRVSAAAAAVEEIRTRAAALESDVQQYQDQFQSFQSHLDAREQALVKGNEELKKLQSHLSQSGSEITKLVSAAQEMLGSATIAGLSSAYQNQASGVDRQLKWARWGFYASIGLLIASVAVATNLTALVGYAPLPTIQTGGDASTLAVQTLASLGARALIILPALLLAGFAARRHSALFRLREEYNHKATLAASVHGFKTQAPLHEQAIAAAVFQELLANPAGTMDKSTEDTRENGFVARLIGPTVERTLQNMMEVKENPAGR
jgi:predicted  nucleic acid-binding Zn-ribbon protein